MMNLRCRYLALCLMMCMSLPTWASITLVQSNSSTTAAVSTATCALSSAVGAGDLIIGGVMWGAQSGSFAMTDDHSNSYSAVPSNPINDVAAGGNSMYVAYAKNTSSQTSLTLTITITGGGTHTIRMGCYEYSATNGWQSTVLDTSSVNGPASNVNTGTPGNITPAATGELIFSALEVAGAITASSFTVSAGCTIREAGGSAGAGWASQTKADGADNQNSGNTSTTCTFNWTTTSNYAAVIAAFKPATAAAASTNKPALVF